MAGCSRPAPQVTHAAEPSPGTSQSPNSGKREIRLTGTIEAVRTSKVLVPQIFGPGGAMTLTKLINNGVTVKEQDLVAVFDSTAQGDAARAAQAKYDDLGHQAEQKRAQNRADIETRMTALRQAEADFAKAEMELKKGPVLAEIELEKAKIRLETAREHVASLKKSNTLHDRADAAALRIIELQRDRQKVALDRAQTNIARLQVRAPLAGMVALQNVYRNNSMGKPQEGDQLWRGQPIMSIFDPSEMLVRCAVGEPDGASLVQGTKATVYVDAYPDLALPASFVYASPVASSALGSPIKTFAAVFRLEQTSPKLMPDLSAAVVISSPGGAK